MIVPGSNGNSYLNFEASAAPAWSQVREQKMCELCGRSFTRMVPLAGRRQTECPPCEKNNEQFVEQQKAQLERSLAMKAAHVERQKNIHAARKALTMQSNTEATP